MSIAVRSTDMLDNRMSVLPVVELLDALEYKRHRRGDGIRPSVLRDLPRVLVARGMTKEAANRVANQLQA